MTRRAIPVFAAVFALLLSSPLAAQRDRDRDRDQDRDRDRGPKETETVERTLTLAPGGTVRLKTFSGRVTITGTAGNEVVIKAVRRATRDRLNDITLEITQSGSVIDIDANHRAVERRNENVVETDLDIQVPREVTLDLRTFSAPVTVTGVGGDVAVEGFSSPIRLIEVAGPKRIKTFSGEVTVQADRFNDGDDMQINTFSGDVVLRLPDTARGEIQFDSFSGRFNSDLPVAVTSTSRRNFRGSLNGGGGTDFRLHTFSGSVTIQR